MKIASLREFASLAKHGRFAAAAKACGVSQSALSKHVAELEDEVGVCLVERHPSVRLTPAGKVLLDRAEEIIYLHGKAIEECRRAGLTASERLVVYKSAVLDVASVALMQACGRYARSHPTVELGFLPDGGASLMGALETGAADLGILRSFEDGLESFTTRGGVECRMVAFGQVGAGVWMTRDNPLAEKPALRPSDLEGVPMLVPAGDAFETERLTTYSFFRRFGVVPRYAYVHVDSIEELAMASLAGRVQLLTDHTDAMQLMCGDDLVRRDMEPPLRATVYAMLRASDAVRLAELVDLLTQAGRSATDGRAARG